MGSQEDLVTLAAAALLRGDLQDLRPAEFEEIDSELHAAVQALDPAEGALQVRTVVAADPGLRARLRSFERDIGAADGDPWASPSERGYALPPGDASLFEAQVWTCPEAELGHYRRRQRVANQDMGVCPVHRLPLVREKRLT